MPGDAPTITWTRPPIPLIWLDTWVFRRIATVRAGEYKAADAGDFEEAFERLIALRDARKVLCPETGHDLEVEAGRHLLKEKRGVMTQISLGVRTHYQHARNQQIFRGMNAYATGAKSIELPWTDVFLGDPLRELERREILIRVNMDTTSEQLADVRRANEEIARGLEDLRLKVAAKRQSFERRLEIELNGAVEAALEIGKLDEQVAAGRLPPVDELLRYITELADPRGVLDRYLHDATGRAGGTVGLVEFYKSPYYRTLPSVRILAELYAVKLTGGEPIKPSDVTDMNQIAAMVPFASVMILDKSMNNKAARLKLPKRFDVKIVQRASELNAVIAGF